MSKQIWPIGKTLEKRFHDFIQTTPGWNHLSPHWQDFLAEIDEALRAILARAEPGEPGLECPSCGGMAFEYFPRCLECGEHLDPISDTRPAPARGEASLRLSPIATMDMKYATPAPDALRWEAIAKQWAHEAELARQPDKFYEKYDEKAMNAMQALLTQANAKTDALRDVMAERKRQDAKWGEQNHDPFTYLTVLMEEVGEFAQAALHARFGGKAAVKLREEAVHSAAVALAIVECIDRNKWTWSTTAFTAAEATP